MAVTSQAPKLSPCLRPPGPQGHRVWLAIFSDTVWFSMIPASFSSSAHLYGKGFTFIGGISVE